MIQRKHILYNQPRAHTVGNVEYINNEWVFFDDENEEAFLLEDIAEDGFEILYNNNWLPLVSMNKMYYKSPTNSTICKMGK